MANTTQDAGNTQTDAVLSALDAELIKANATFRRAPTAENKLAAHHAQQAFDQRKELLAKQGRERLALEERKIAESLRTDAQRATDARKLELKAKRAALEFKISDFTVFAAPEIEALIEAFVECERAFLALLHKRDVEQAAIIDEIYTLSSEIGDTNMDSMNQRHSSARDTRHYYSKFRAEIVKRCREKLNSNPVNGDLWGALTKSMRAIAGDGIL